MNEFNRSVVVVSALALASACFVQSHAVAQTSASARTPASSTPCRRHFVRISWSALQLCVTSFAPRGLSLHAFAVQGGAAAPDHAVFSGSFEPGPPREALLQNLPWDACPRMVAMYDGAPDAVPAVCGNTAADPKVQVVMLAQNYTTAGHPADLDVDLGDPRIRRRYVALVSQLASRGLAPYRVIVHDKMGAGVSPEAGILAQRVPPHDTASIYLPDARTLAAFEARARAKGFQPFSYGSAAVIWRKHVGKTVVMRSHLSDVGFAAADAQQTKAGLALIDLTAEKPGWRAIWAR